MCPVEFIITPVRRSPNTVFLLSSSSSGQGSKICSFADTGRLSQPHTVANREMLMEWLANERQVRLDNSTPWRDIFTRTVAFLASIKKLGCGFPLFEPTALLPHEQLEHDKLRASQLKFQRGCIRPPASTCEGRLLLEFDNKSHQFFLRYVTCPSNLC